jgi:hypothetical protein
MKHVVWVALLGLVLCAGCGGKAAVSTGPQSAKLEYKQLGGQSVEYKMTSGQTVNLQGSTESSVTELTYSARVESIGPDGTITRKLTFDAYSSVKISGGTPVPDAAAPEYKGQYLWIKLGADGQVVDWKGLDGIHSFTAEDRDFRNLFVTEMALLFQPLPKEEIKIGSTWTNVVEIPVTLKRGEFKVNTTSDYQVVGFGLRAGRNCAKLAIKAKATGEGSGEGYGEKKYWIDAQEEGKGEAWFDYENGLLVEYSMGGTSDLTVSYERAGKTDVATEAMTVDSQTKIKLVK